MRPPNVPAATAAPTEGEHACPRRGGHGDQRTRRWARSRSAGRGPVHAVRVRARPYVLSLRSVLRISCATTAVVAACAPLEHVQTIESVLVLSPTDLVAFTGCEHRSFLDRRWPAGQLERPRRDDPFKTCCVSTGAPRAELPAGAHAAAAPRWSRSHARRARSRGSAAEAETLAAMRAGVDVIYQASFFDGRWRGHADFLRRVDTPSRARAVELRGPRHQAGALHQGGHAPAARRLLAPGGAAAGPRPAALHVASATAQSSSSSTRTSPPTCGPCGCASRPPSTAGWMATSPDPVALCAYCDWKDRCTAQWRRDDHLSLVAGARRDQRTRLVAAGISTRAALAGCPAGTEVDQIRAPALEALAPRLVCRWRRSVRRRHRRGS